MDFLFEESTHTFWVDGQKWPSITQILTAEGFIDPEFYTEYGRQRGSLLHKVIHWHVIGELDESSVAPELQGRYSAWLAFEQDTGFRSIEVEKPAISELYRFAGIPDHYCRIFGKEAVIDAKSGGKEAWHGLQTAAQEILIGKSLPRYSLHLKENGKYKLEPHTDRTDRQVFLSAAACWWWKNNHLRR